MTLVLNEIHVLNGLGRTVMVAAADRRISLNGKYFGTHPKLFPIPYLNGAVSYFGLAAFPDSTSKMRGLWDWLPAFIRREAAVPDLKTFSYNLHKELQRAIPSAILSKHPSGFHICGYNAQFLPEFWFLTNIREMNGFTPSRWEPTYKSPAPHFLERNARGPDFQWDGVNPDSCKNGVQIYRNGDFRAHAIASDLLDEIFKRLWQFTDFKKPEKPSEYRDYVRFKFEFIASLYKRWAKYQLIDRPIDVRVWSADAKRRVISVH